MAANNYPTVSDLVADALNLSGFELSSVKNMAPVLMQMPAVESSDGDNHRYAVYDTAPTVGFRAENAGRVLSHSGDSITTVALKIMDWSFGVDKAVADRWRQGGAADYIAREGLRHLGAAMFKFEQQFFNGTGADAAGFNGLTNSANLNQIADEMVTTAGGDEANKQTSCYLLRVNPAECAAVFKGDSFQLGETVITHLPDNTAPENVFPAYYTPATSWFAGQIGSIYSAARICNINNVEDSNPLTDDLIYKALSTFPAGMGPNLIVCNQAALEMLRKSRTATNVTGAPAPLPTEVTGIPVVTTDAITSTEAVIS